MERKRTTGVVLRIFSKSGYCFLLGDDDVAYFGHQTQCEPGLNINELRIGQRCSFIATMATRGPFAALIQLDYPLDELPSTTTQHTHR